MTRLLREYLHFSEANSESQVNYCLSQESAKKAFKDPNRLWTVYVSIFLVRDRGYYDPMGKQSQFSVKHV